MMPRRVCHNTLLMVFALLVVAVGCQRTGTVTGKVTHQGKPVVSGTVSIIGSDDIQYTGQISPEGTYAVTDVPNGPVKILVSSPNPHASRPEQTNPIAIGDGGQVRSNSGPEPPAELWFPIPPEYAELDKSTLTGTVSSATTIDLDLP
jgi:hypothetical protein